MSDLNGGNVPKGVSASNVKRKIDKMFAIDEELEARKELWKRVMNELQAKANRFMNIIHDTWSLWYTHEGMFGVKAFSLELDTSGPKPRLQMCSRIIEKEPMVEMDQR